MLTKFENGDEVDITTLGCVGKSTEPSGDMNDRIGPIFSALDTEVEALGTSDRELAKCRLAWSGWVIEYGCEVSGTTTPTTTGFVEAKTAAVRD